jgi:hypothetical protein
VAFWSATSHVLVDGRHNFAVSNTTLKTNVNCPSSGAPPIFPASNDDKFTPRLAARPGAG